MRFSQKMKILELIVVFSVLSVETFANTYCPLVCDENEIFTDCSLGQFQSTCWNSHIWFDETALSCAPGCDCRKGFIRDPNTYKCIDQRKCQRIPVEEVCPKNEIWSECGFRCDETCDFLNNRDLICRSCVSGCICKKGYVRSTLTGQCILRKDCDGNLKTNNFLDILKFNSFNYV